MWTKLALATLLSCVLAVPVAEVRPRTQTSPSNPFTLSIIHNRNTTLNGQEINASGLSLFLGLAGPSTYCPVPTVPAADCPAGVETAFSGLLSMDVEVPGGQLAYVAADGAVGYTQAHSAALPPGAVTVGFSWTPLHTNSVLGERGYLDFQSPGETSSGFFACPTVPEFVTGATYQIYAAVPGLSCGNCIELGKLLTTQFKLEQYGAWQYA